MKITEFHIELSKKNVLASIDVDENSDLYEEIEEEFEEMLPRAYEKIQPAALLAFGDISDYGILQDGETITTALYGINSVGSGLSKWSTQLFAEGDYLKGMIADAMADDYLFQMDQAVQSAVVELCRENGYGIAKRLEAPQDIPISIQKRAFDATDAQKEIGLKIKESFMYDPVKTVCQVYILDRNTSRFHSEHDCGKCDNLTCRMRKIPKVSVLLKTGAWEQRITAEKNKSLLQTLQERQILVTAVCGGKGSCGKCRVRVTQGAAAPTEADRKCFRKEELEDGYRLACRFYPEQDCVVELENREEEFLVVTDQETVDTAAENLRDRRNMDQAVRKRTESEGNLREDTGYGIAVDIGTTTIAMQLVDFGSGQAVDVYTAINRQRSFGADVISRIEASNSGHREELRRSIRKELLRGTEVLAAGKKAKIRKMVIGANTTMVHLLMGYSCETLGVYPFTPVNIETLHTSFEELFGDMISRAEGEFSDLKRFAGADDFSIMICPGISTYVGGDILAGMYALGFEQTEKINVLIDLGTNGEMAIGNKDRILVASTAAGPAFEGGNIICGTGSIPGAICGVSLKGSRADIKTIGDKVPTGICGTGVIDTVYELMRAEIIDETGRMEDPYFDEGFLLAEETDAGGKEIRFYQKDVREIQLAKSAVRAGLETLISRYGTSCDEIEKIYIAGGFGYKMDIRKAAGIGLLPAECILRKASEEKNDAPESEEKIVAVGNSCLQGTRKCLSETNAEVALRCLKEHSQEISLSEDKLFQELYMEYMYFE